MEFEGSFPDLAMNDEDIDFESFFRSLEEEQRQQSTMPSSLPSTSIELGHSDDADLKTFESSLIDLLDKQQAEVDQYLHLQNERLGESLYRQRRRHIALLKDHLEQNTSVLLRMKDEKLETMSMQYLDLYENLKKAEELKDAWQRIANDKDAMISSLTSAQQTHISSTGEAMKAEHCCCNCLNKGKEEDTPTWVSYHVSTPCNCCGIRDACMLFLPCRHISACKECEATLGACLVCGSVKKETIEVLVN